MTRHEKMVVSLVSDTIDGAAYGDILCRLMDEGLLDRSRCERRAIRLRVERLRRGGEHADSAMRQVAQEFCCSYGKVRDAVYEKS